MTLRDRRSKGRDRRVTEFQSRGVGNRCRTRDLQAGVAEIQDVSRRLEGKEKRKKALEMRFEVFNFLQQRQELRSGREP